MYKKQHFLLSKLKYNFVTVFKKDSLKHTEKSLTVKILDHNLSLIRNSYDDENQAK